MRKRRALDLFCGAGGASWGLRCAGFDVTGVDSKPQSRYPCRFIQADALTVSLDGYDFIWASPPCQAFTKLRFLPTAKQHPNLIPQVRARLIESGIPYVIENVEDAPLGESGHLIMLCGTMFGLQTADGRAELRRHRLFECSLTPPLVPDCQHGRVESLTICGTGLDGNADAWRRRTIGVFGKSMQENFRVRAARKTISVVGHCAPQPWRCRDAITVAGDRAMGSVSGRRAITITGHTPQTNTDRNRTRETYSIKDAQAAMGINWMPMVSLSQAIPPAYSEFIGRHALAQLGSTIAGFGDGRRQEGS